VIRAALILGFIGLAGATALFLKEGVAAIFLAFAAAGTGILWASLFHAVPMALNARAWQVLLPARRRRPSLSRFFWAVWLREAVNGLLPVARIGGEVVTAQLLVGYGMRTASAVASIVVDVTVSLASQFLFTISGVALLAAYGGGVGAETAAALGGALAVVVALALAQRFGLFGLLARIGNALLGGRFDRLAGGAAPLDRAVRRLYRRRAAVLACGLWQLAGWIAGAGEVWIALRFLGLETGFIPSLVVESVVQAASSAAFVVPAALGVQEGGFAVVAGLVGIPVEIGLALALMRRAREVILFAPALLFWQWRLGRRLFARSEPAP
jgi:glycosyltransferase 2 family protein